MAYLVFFPFQHCYTFLLQVQDSVYEDSNSDFELCNLLKSLHKSKEHMPRPLFLAVAHGLDVEEQVLSHLNVEAFSQRLTSLSHLIHDLYLDLKSNPQSPVFALSAVLEVVRVVVEAPHNRL